MGRVLLPFILLVALVGCAVPPERVAPPLLLDENVPLPYAQLVGRARSQAIAANEAFYVNNWNDLEDAAKGLEQTARVLTKATDVPPRHKDLLPVEAGDLGKEAVSLRLAARAKETTQATTALQRIQLKVRELRPDG
jgi:hypothetical protein